MLAVTSLRDSKEFAFSWLVLYALLLAAAFVLLFGIQRSPKPPHYILTSYVALDVIAGLGFVRGWELLIRRFPRLGGPGIAAVGHGGW